MPQALTKLWLGTQESFEASEIAALKAEAFTAENFKIEGLKADMTEEEYYSQLAYDSMVSIQDGVAIVTIKGSLIDGNAGYGIRYGRTGYDDVRNVLGSLAGNPNVSAIVLNISSGGGDVAGVMGATDMLGRVGKLKPIVSYTGSSMMSAAMWLGGNAQYIMAAPVALVGSIGVIRVHVEYSKQLAENGVTATVIRAGEEKALGTPYEPLSDKAKQVLQDQANAIYDIFLPAMAAARGMSVTTAESKIGQGKVFVGKEAVAAGLIDAVGSLEDAFNKAKSLAKRAGTDKQRMVTTNSGKVTADGGASLPQLADNPSISKDTSMPAPYTDEQLAAMAAGVELPGDTEVTASATPATTPAADAAPAPETAPATAPAAPAADASALLQSMLAQAQEATIAARAEVLAVKAELKAAQDKQAADAVLFDSAVAVARASVTTMGLHFGLDKTAVAAMSASEVLAEHARLSDLFREKFKTGRVAAAAAASDKPTQASDVNPLFAAAIQAQRR